MKTQTKTQTQTVSSCMDCPFKSIPPENIWLGQYTCKELKEQIKNPAEIKDNCPFRNHSPSTFDIS